LEKEAERADDKISSRVDLLHKSFKGWRIRFSKNRGLKKNRGNVRLRKREDSQAHACLASLTGGNSIQVCRYHGISTEKKEKRGKNA